MSADTDTDIPFSPLVGAIITQMFTDSGATTNALVDNLTAQLATERAHRAAVEHEVGRLLSGDFMPTSHAIERAVFCPPQALIDHYRSQPEES